VVRNTDGNIKNNVLGIEKNSSDSNQGYRRIKAWM